jgi:tetratricopeptide (TPR) repeat protein
LCAGIGVAVSQANAARAQARIAATAQRQAELETERAKAEEQKAERTTRFLQSFLENANPIWYARGKGRFDVTLREAIDDAAGRIDTELADEPEVRADLHYTLGEIYRVADEREMALRHFRQSLDLYRQVHGEQNPRVARAIYYVSLSETEGEKAEALLRQAIAIMRQTNPDDVNLPYMLQSLAHWIMRDEQRERNENRLAEAESMILESKTLFIRHYGENHGSTVTADTSLAMLAQTRGDLARAESIHEETLARYREGDVSHLNALVDFAGVKLALGKRAEAETLFDQATGLGRRNWGAEDPRFKLLLTRIGEARAAARK